MIFIAYFMAIQISFAQSIAERPPRSAEVVEALSLVSWKTLDGGYEHLRVMSALGVHLDAFKFAPGEFTFAVAQQGSKNGEAVAEIGRREGALLAVNGGFFSKSADGSLKPVGLLIDNGERVSKAWTEDGGYLVINAGELNILPTRETLDGGETEVLQTKPVILEAGGNWALRTNTGFSENRTLVCIQPDRYVVLIIVSGQGMSLFEAGWVLRNGDWGGWFGCDTAIALDGGGSTQLYAADKPDLSISGETVVQNAFLVKQKQ